MRGESLICVVTISRWERGGVRDASTPHPGSTFGRNTSHAAWARSPYSTSFGARCGRGSPSYWASYGCHRHCFISNRRWITSSFSGVPGGADVGNGGSGAALLTFPGPRRPYLLSAG